MVETNHPEVEGQLDSLDNIDSKTGLNGWWKLVVGILIGAIAPSLVAWGSMNAKIENNAEMIRSKVSVEVFDEYKRGNTRLLESINASLVRIESKIDKRVVAK